MNTQTTMPVSSRLGFDTTIPRTLVHRRAVHEVFLTDSLALSADHILCTAQLPKVHSYFNDHTLHWPKYDLLLLMEVFRQAQFVACHRYLGVTMGSKFIFVDGHIESADPGALTIGDAPGHALIDLHIVDRRFRQDELVGIVLEMKLSIDRRDAASMKMTVRWMPPQAWTTLRQRSRAELELPDAPEPVTWGWIDPASVGRCSRKNVVIASLDGNGLGMSGVVGVDQQHPSLFDHPLDHIPGMLLFEAYRQAAIATAHYHLGML